MDTQRALSVIPELQAVTTELGVVETMMAYVMDKTPLKDAMLEVKTMSEWTPSSIKGACKSVVDVLGARFEQEMSDFNERAEASVDSISLEPFQERFAEEIQEQENLRAASLKVIEIASRVAVTLNIPVPAATPTTTPATPKKNFKKAILSMIVEEKKGKPSQIQTPMSWLTPAVLREDDDAVQQVALLDSKKSVEAMRTLITRFKKTDAEITKIILDVISDARAQIAQSDAISANVTADFNQKSSVVTVILDVLDSANKVHNYVSGK